MRLRADVFNSMVLQRLAVKKECILKRRRATLRCANVEVVVASGAAGIFTKEK